MMRCPQASLPFMRLIDAKLQISSFFFVIQKILLAQRMQNAYELVRVFIDKS